MRNFATINSSRSRKYLLILFTFFTSFSNAQQVADSNYSPPQFVHKYPNGLGSVVMIDEAHNNFHTSQGRYSPFVKILTKDGYRIVKGTNKFTKKSLEKVKILVIANAINAANIERWTLPTPSAFTSEEITNIQEWVKNGGSLFLIADHMPFAGAATDLAKAFGFTFYNGFAINAATYMMGLPDVFKRSDFTFQSLEFPSLIPVDSIASFIGQGFSIPTGAVSILNLDERFKIFLPIAAWKFDKNTQWVSGKGKSQGAYLQFGKGRLMVFGEAAMFSAQIVDGHKVGMNTTEGANNYLLLLTIIHWLDGLN